MVKCKLKDDYLLKYPLDDSEADKVSFFFESTFKIINLTRSVFQSIRLSKNQSIIVPLITN